MRLAVLLAALVSISAAAAQPQIGVRVGVSALETRFNNDDVIRGTGISKDARLGFAAGVFASVPVSEALSIRPGLSYAQKGYRVVIEGAEAGSATLGADYLEAPLLLGFRVPGTGLVDLDFELGPVFGYRVRTVQECDGGLESSCDGFDYNDDLNRTEIGGVVGVGIGSGGFGVDVRYSSSLSRVDDPDVPAFNEVRFSGITAAARYTFGP